MEKPAAQETLPAPALSVKSHLLSALGNTLGILFAYVLIAALYLWYLKRYADLDLVAILLSAFEGVRDTALGGIAELFEHLVENYLHDTIIFAAIYSAYITNNRLEIREGHLQYQRGLFLLHKTQVPLDDIEEVYTKKYPFFKTTKALSIVSLDEQTIKMPYVADADEVKRTIIREVKKRKDPSSHL